MPITGEFIADFADFIRGAKQAEGAIDGLEAKSTELGTGLAGALQSFDLSRLLANPIEESTRLLTTFSGALDTSAIALGGLGAAAVAAGVAVADGAIAIAKADVATGRLADSLGIAVPELSRLQQAAIVAGVDIGKVTDLIGDMQKRLATNPDAFAKGLKAIGVSFAEFQAMSPVEKIEALSSGLEGLVDPTDRARAGTELLGGAYRDLVPTVNDLATAEQKIKDQPVVTAEDVAQAKRLTQDIAALELTFSNLGNTIKRAVVPAFADLIEAIVNAPVWRDTAKEIKFIADQLQFLNIALEAQGGLARETMPAIQGLAEHHAAWGKQVADLLPKVPTLTDALAHQRDLTREQSGLLEKAAAAQKAWADAMGELDSAGQGWRGTLEGIDGEVVAAVEYYLQAGVSQTALATAYGLTATQVRAVEAALKDEKKAADDAAKSADAEIKAWETYAKTVSAGSINVTQQRIDDAWRAADAQILALAKAGTLTESAYAAIVATANAATDNIIAATLRSDPTTKAHYEQLAAQAQQAYDFAAAHADQYTDERLLQLRAEADAAKITLADWQAAAEKAMKGTENAAGQAKKAIHDVTDEVKAAKKVVDDFVGTMLPTPDSLRASTLEPGSMLGLGMPNISPLSYSLSGLAKTPIVNSITINGSVLGNKDEIARVVGDALASSYRSGGNRLPA
jgi:hypothetical protein